MRKSYRYWTLAELELLDREYPHRTAQELQAFFPHRSLSSIMKKAGRRSREQKLEKEGGLWRRYSPEPSKVKEMTDFWKGYVSGMIDGEGTIHIQRDKRGFLHPRVRIANTNEEALRKIQEITGIGNIRKHGVTSRWKTVWYWTVYGVVNIEALLSQLTERLIIKRKQAELVLRFVRVYLSRPSYAEVTPEMRNIYEEVKRLNRRGHLIMARIHRSATDKPLG